MPNATLDLVVSKLDEVHQEQKSQRMEIAELKQAITQLQVRDEERWPMQQTRVTQVEALLREVERDLESLKRALDVHKAKAAGVGALGGGGVYALAEIIQSLMGT